MYLLQLKSDVCVIVEQLLKLIQSQFSKIIKDYRTDRDIEFVNEVYNIILKILGFIHQRSCVNSP